MPMKQDFEKYQPDEPRPPAAIEPGVVISPDTHRDQRIPPGQVRTRKWPVLHYGRVPIVPTDKWTLQIGGQVERPTTFTWEQFQGLPRVKVYSDFHCVTRWSRLDNVWEGVSVKHLLELVGVKKEARYAIAFGYDDEWSTNMPLADFAVDDALVADLHDGQPLSADHGGPARLIVPRLYAWKSAKWVKAIVLSTVDQPGLWERAGYHNHGDPWKEERYGW